MSGGDSITEQWKCSWLRSHIFTLCLHCVNPLIMIWANPFLAIISNLDPTIVIIFHFTSVWFVGANLDILLLPFFIFSDLQCSPVEHFCSMCSFLTAWTHFPRILFSISSLFFCHYTRGLYKRGVQVHLSLKEWTKPLTWLVFILTYNSKVLDLFSLDSLPRHFQCHLVYPVNLHTCFSYPD